MRPLTGPRRAYATRRDLELTLRINPFLACIGGHAVVPWGDLGDSGRLKYITLLRNPVDRAVSQYAFWIQRMGKTLSPERFLEHHTAGNFQVKKIAGRPDVNEAKRILQERFLLVGTVEHFDEFLVMLAAKLGLSTNTLIYRLKNAASERGEVTLPDGFRDRLTEINQLDIALYSWVQDELVPRFRQDFPGDLAEALAAFRRRLIAGQKFTWRRPLDLVYRNLWMKPLTGLIRLANGLQYEGSYAVPRTNRKRSARSDQRIPS